jgi:hypothetical protein
MNKIEKLREVNKQLQEICDDIETKLFLQNERIDFNESIKYGDKTIKE